jgi:CBS domain containing-hemolysin-like protein
MAVVLDEHGGTAGVLTSEDLFEEVVGDIGDDATKKLEVVRNPDGSVTAAGVARLEALGDAIGVELEHEMVDTVSGLVLSLLGRPPRVGDVVAYEAVGIEVTAVEGLGVAQVRASLLR